MHAALSLFPDYPILWQLLKLREVCDGAAIERFQTEFSEGACLR